MSLKFAVEFKLSLLLLRIPYSTPMSNHHNLDVLPQKCLRIEVYRLRLYQKQPTKLICHAIALGRGDKSEIFEDLPFKHVPWYPGIRYQGNYNSTRVPGFHSGIRIPKHLGTRVPRVPRVPWYKKMNLKRDNRIVCTVKVKLIWDNITVCTHSEHI